MRQTKVTKEDLLAQFNSDWKPLSPITRYIRLPYYLGKVYAAELVAEGKLEQCQFGKNTRYRKKTELGGHNGEIEAVKTPICFEEAR